MKLNRLVIYIMAGIAVLLALFAYIEYIYLLGYPDGFISELAAAERQLAYFFIGISLFTALYFVYCAWRAPQLATQKRIYTISIIYVVCIITMLLLDGWYRVQVPETG